MRLLYFIFLLSVLTGCLESGLDFTPVDNNTALDYDVSATFSGPNDAYNIVGISPEEGKLNMYLSYSGGCQVHTFRVVWDGEVKEVNNYKEIFLKVFHQANEDPCEALLKPVITIDLKSVLGSIQTDDSTRIIVQNASNGRTITIDPLLAQIRQTNICQLNTSFENSLCGYGIWQNNWFRLTDSLGTGDNIWLQPVAHNPEISSLIPTKGKYDLGVTLLMGYQTPEDPSCLTIPSGQVIPVEVNCISRIE
ncbi:MAG: NigD-like C-terminal domain-containing protein [Cyclobacteriaceae bacterium]